MLRWFRKYQMYILVAGAALLMIAFLIEPTISMFQPGRGDQELGRTPDRTFTVEDQQRAQVEMRVVQSLSSVLRFTLPNDPMVWMLAQHEAAQMGLDAGDYEVQLILSTLQNPGENSGAPKMGDVAAVAKQHRVDEPFVRESLRKWAVFMAYREAVAGTGHVAFDERMRSLASAFSSYFQGDVMGYASNIDNAMGTPRISRSVAERIVYDQYSRVQIALVEIDAQRYVDDVDKPTDEQLKSLFDEYKDDLPGSSEPFGFGYKHPDRVKLEYLAIPIERVRETIRVTEADMIARYEQKKDDYIIVPRNPDGSPDTSKPPVQRTYEDMRSQIKTDLMRERAEDKAAKMVKFAQSLLLDDARKVKTGSDGYRDVEAAKQDGWEPMPLGEVRDKLKKQFDVMPDQRTLDKNWLTTKELVDLEGIGDASLILGDPKSPAKIEISFAEYVSSTHELKPADGHRAITQRLQAWMPSMPLRTVDDSRYLFRVRAAEDAHEPKDMAEVRFSLERDAKRKAAWDKLAGEKGDWLLRANREGLDKLAKDLKVSVITPRPFPKREVSQMGMASVPDVTTVGRHEAFVDAVFALAYETQTRGEEVALVNPTGVVTVDATQKLYVVRIDSYQPVVEQLFNLIAGSPMVPMLVQQGVVSALDEEELKDGRPNPLALHVIAARIGFVDDEGKKLKSPKEKEAEDKAKAEAEAKKAAEAAKKEAAKK